MGYLYRKGDHQPFLACSPSTCGLGFQEGCQPGCTRQSLLLGHSELWLTGMLHQCPLGWPQAPEMEAKDALLEDVWRQHLLAPRAVRQPCAIPSWSGPWIGSCSAALSMMGPKSDGSLFCRTCRCPLGSLPPWKSLGSPVSSLFVIDPR